MNISTFHDLKLLRNATSQSKIFFILDTLQRLLYHSFDTWLADSSRLCTSLVRVTVIKYLHNQRSIDSVNLHYELRQSIWLILNKFNKTKSLGRNCSLHELLEANFYLLDIFSYKIHHVYVSMTDLSKIFNTQTHQTIKSPVLSDL